MSRVVIVGGGIAGVVLATRLGRLRDPGIDVLLIDRNFAHVWKPMLHRFAAGTATYATQSIPFASQAKRNGFQFWPAECVGIDRSRKDVCLGQMKTPDGRGTLPERTIGYDRLVLALGSRSDDYGTTGVAAHCLTIDDIGQAEAVHRALRSRVLEATANNDIAIPVVIVGGGATGVELAAELSKSEELLARYSPSSHPAGLRITLIESGPRVLAPFPESVSRDATAKLQQLGIAVRLGTKVLAVDERGVILDGGERVDGLMRVWAAGVKAPAVTGALDGLATNAKGQIVVAESLRSVSDDSIYAVGDCAALERKDGKPLPTTAQVARQQAIFLARAFGPSASAHPSSFAYDDKGSIVTLGPYAAYASLGGHGLLRAGTIKGPLAQIGHAALYRMHQLDLLGMARGSVGWLADDLLRLARPRVDLE